MSILKTSGRRHLTCLVCIGWLLTLALKPPFSIAASQLLIDADAQYEFAITLFNQQDYKFSIKELQRFIYFFPNDKRVPLALSFIGQAHFHTKAYKKAIKTFEGLLESHEDHPEAYNSFFFISDCYLKLENPQQAIITLKNLIMLTKSQTLLDQAYYKMAWIAVETGVRFEAAKILQQTSPAFQKQNMIPQMIDDLSINNSISYKNPTLAGMLSTLPGAGQLYCGRYKDALSAFVINTGLILAAVESFDKEMYALGATITFFELGFYAGNIHGATTSAYKYNENQLLKFNQKLHKKYRMGLLPAKQNSNIMVSFQYLY